MKKIGIYLVILGIAILGSYYIYNSVLEKQAKNGIDDYINNTSIVNETEIEEEVEEEKPKEEENKNVSNNINYTAIIEIPKINLKRGVVDSTKNFKSINYAISVDSISKYPNEIGNFILYAHSGTSNISFFRNLNKVNINDKVYVYYNGIKYEYEIFKKYDIEKTGKAGILTTNSEKYITLITCNPNKKGYQVVVIGKQVNKVNY